jgi:hypothetical protein
MVQTYDNCQRFMETATALVEVMEQCARTLADTESCWRVPTRDHRTNLPEKIDYVARSQEIRASLADTIAWCRATHQQTEDVRALFAEVRARSQAGVIGKPLPTVVKSRRAVTRADGQREAVTPSTHIIREETAQERPARALPGTPEFQ